ncbi:MAG: hypothetical protein J6C97_02765, partial [Clostridia bacterium]|nr:hypothetical protein [Clostridia bacterium]
MKKFRFFLLLVLTLVFTFTLSIGTFTVLAEDTNSGGGSSSVVDTEVATYSSLFSGNDFAISKDPQKGLKVSLSKAGAEATSKNFFSIGEQGEYFVSSAQVDVTNIESAELFYVRLVPDASSSSDTIHFWYKKTTDGTTETKKVYVTFNNDTVEFELGNTFVEYSTETIDQQEHTILTIKDFKVEIVNKEVFVDAYSTTEKIGDSLNIYPYAKLQVYAKTASTFYLKSLYRLDSSNASICKADFVTGTSSFKYGAEYYYNDTDSFFARDNAIYGYDYNVVLVAYDFLSGVDKSLRYTKIKEADGSAVATPEEKTAENYAEMVFDSQGV